MRARVGGQGGGHRRLLESDRNWQESDNALERPAPRRGAADPNAPCGASTAAPVFGDRRLVQLIAFCKLQIID